MALELTVKNNEIRKVEMLTDLTWHPAAARNQKRDHVDILM